jgi:hypothetical protein
MKKTIAPKSLNFDDLSWCIDNDFQVYLVPMDSQGNGKYKIAVRRRGITTEGKDYAYVDGLRIDSKVTLGDRVYRNSLEATNYLNNVYGYLRRTHG